LGRWSRRRARQQVSCGPLRRPAHAAKLVQKRPSTGLLDLNPHRRALQTPRLGSRVRGSDGEEQQRCRHTSGPTVRLHHPPMPGVSLVGHAALLLELEGQSSHRPQCIPGVESKQGRPRSHGGFGDLEVAFR
jgi:hypothetical protein